MCKRRKILHAKRCESHGEGNWETGSDGRIVETAPGRSRAKAAGDIRSAGKASERRVQSGGLAKAEREALLLLLGELEAFGECASQTFTALHGTSSRDSVPLAECLFCWTTVRRLCAFCDTGCSIASSVTAFD